MVVDLGVEGADFVDFLFQETKKKRWKMKDRFEGREEEEEEDD